MAGVNDRDPSGSYDQVLNAPQGSGWLIGVQGRLHRPLWGVVGGWAVLCGALASGRLSWHSQDLVALSLVVLLVELGWGSLWDLLVGVDWFEPLLTGWSRVKPANLRMLPYTQPHSPAGWLHRKSARLVGWWRSAFWPAYGPASLGLLAAAGLSLVLALLLPVRLLPLHLMLWALLAGGLLWRSRGRAWLAGQALSQATLGWLAGQGAFAPWEPDALVLALSFGLAIWGALRMTQKLAGAVLLLVSGQALATLLLIVLKHPLSAGLVGGLIVTQIALCPALLQGADPYTVSRRGWFWLMAAMLVTAVAFL